MNNAVDDIIAFAYQLYTHDIISLKEYNMVVQAAIEDRYNGIIELFGVFTDYPSFF